MASKQAQGIIPWSRGPEPARDNGPQPTYVLKLYITGMTPRSQRALEALKEVIKQYLADDCELEVIDIYQLPALARGDRVIAVPTLIKKLPAPVRRLVGDLSVKERIIHGLGLNPRPAQEAGSIGSD